MVCDRCVACQWRHLRGCNILIDYVIEGRACASLLLSVCLPLIDIWYGTALLNIVFPKCRLGNYEIFTFSVFARYCWRSILTVGGFVQFSDVIVRCGFVFVIIMSSRTVALTTRMLGIFYCHIHSFICYYLLYIICKCYKNSRNILSVFRRIVNFNQ